MSASIFTTPPGGDTCYVRDDAIVVVGAPFHWSPTLLAREVRLGNGDRLIIEDTDANIRTAVLAMGSSEQADAAVDAAITERAGMATGMDGAEAVRR